MRGAVRRRLGPVAVRVYLVRHTPVDLPEGVCYGRSDVALAAGWEVLKRRHGVDDALAVLQRLGVTEAEAA